MYVSAAEPLDAMTTTETNPPPAGQGQPCDGRISRGPTSPEGEVCSRREGCKDGLTSAGMALPPSRKSRSSAARPDLPATSSPETRSTRTGSPTAPAAWRSQDLAMRIVRHDTRVNAAGFADSDQDQQLAAADLADDSPTIRRPPWLASAWLGRLRLAGRTAWTLLGNALSTAEEGGPDSTWTDADLEFALDLPRPASSGTGQFRGQASSGDRPVPGTPYPIPPRLRTIRPARTGAPAAGGPAASARGR